MKVISGLTLFAYLNVCTARLSLFEKDVIARNDRSLQSVDSVGCTVCSKQTDKKSKPEELFFEFTDDWNQESFWMDSKNSNCHTINPDELVREADGGVEVIVEAYGRFKSLSNGDKFKIKRGRKAFTTMKFKRVNGGVLTCYLHTSCSVPLVAGDTHGPFKILDLGSCQLPAPGDVEGQCTICDKQNKENKGKPITVQYIAAGKDSAYQDGQKASCVAGAYPESAVIQVNGQTIQVVNGTEFTFDPANSAETVFSINGNECFIHTSCSVPIVVGDQIGPFLIKGGAGCGSPPIPPPESGSCSEVCEECLICDKENKEFKPKTLSFKYHSVGLNSKYQPEDKASCREGAYPTSTSITVLGKDIEVQDGQEFTITAPDGKFDAETDFQFADGAVDECFIHTSCSVALKTGDRIGPFEVVGSDRCLPCKSCNCIESVVRIEDDGRYVIDVKLDYENIGIGRDYVANCDPRDETGRCVDGTITDLSPKGDDWVGLYPCSDEEGDLPFSVQPDFWSYTCYDKVMDPDKPEFSKGRCKNGPGIGKTEFTLDDLTAPTFYYQGIYSPLKEALAEPGCYILLLNRDSGFSPPPYYNICKGKKFYLPEDVKA